MRDARSPWSWSGNSYWGHMAWKTAAAGKTASNSPSVRMNFHVLLVLMSPRTMLRRFVLCFSVCVQERTFYFSVEKKKKKSFQAKHVWFMLPRTWICLDLGFNKTNCKACRKAARFCAYRTFFCVSVRWKIHFDLSCCVELSISIFVWHPLCSRYSSTWRSCSLRSSSFTLPPTHFSWFPTGPSLLPLSSSSSSSPIYLFFSSPSLSLSSVSHILLDSALGLMLMTHHPTWKHFLCGCEGAFTAVNENFKQRRPRPAPPEKKKCGWWGGKKQEISFFSSHPNIATFDEGFINF